MLVTHTRKQLAECQKHLGQIEKYPLKGGARKIKTGENDTSDYFSDNSNFYLTVETAKHQTADLFYVCIVAVRLGRVGLFIFEFLFFLMEFLFFQLEFLFFQFKTFCL